jgi:hypothetical protein
MATSRRVPLMILSIAALGVAVAACDSILGLGNYSDVPCQPGDCVGEDSGSFDAPPPPDSTLMDTFEAGADDAIDSGVAVDAAPEAMPPSDAPYDAPPLKALWARWPMPNPDAAIYPGASTLLPNPMAYDAGADGGAMAVLDLVTGLTWWRTPFPTSTPPDDSICPSNFHVPTRIQLVSLIDFTQPGPTIDTTTFQGVNSDYAWTSSQVIDANGAWDGHSYWTVDFSSGLVTATATGNQVLCVQGGP